MARCCVVHACGAHVLCMQYHPLSPTRDPVHVWHRSACQRMLHLYERAMRGMRRHLIVQVRDAFAEAGDGTGNSDGTSNSTNKQASTATRADAAAFSQGAASDAAGSGVSGVIATGDGGGGGGGGRSAADLMWIISSGKYERGNPAPGGDSCHSDGRSSRAAAVAAAAAAASPEGVAGRPPLRVPHLDDDVAAYGEPVQCRLAPQAKGRHGSLSVAASLLLLLLHFPTAGAAALLNNRSLCTFREPLLLPQRSGVVATVTMIGMVVVMVAVPPLGRVKSVVRHDLIMSSKSKCSK
eukprot:365305-Chlamydomonas_euryale.AAC.4